LEVISREGIKKVCKKCFEKNDMPLVKKPIEELPKETRPTSRMRKIPQNKNISYPQNQLLQKQEENLKKIINTNFKTQTPTKSAKANELIENFHWAIMRARRSKKLMQNQLAEEIKEPTEAIKMLEQGIVPEDYYNLIEKIEKKLEILIIKREYRRIEKRLDYEKRNFESFTLSDLKEIQEEKENILDNERKLSDTEIMNLTFGREIE